jgi:hypothetical protein
MRAGSEHLTGVNLDRVIRNEMWWAPPSRLRLKAMVFATAFLRMPT